MSIFLFILGAILLLLSRALAPKEYTAHASREKPFSGPRPMGSSTSLVSHMVSSDGSSVRFDDNTVVVRVDGSSFVTSGLIDGKRVIAKRIAPRDVMDVAQSLQVGDIVIIDGPGEFECGLRFRKFGKLDGDKLHFLPDPTGVPNVRNVSQLWAKVVLKEVA